MKGGERGRMKQSEIVGNEGESEEMRSIGRSSIGA